MGGIMKTEELKELGLTDDQIKKVFAMNGKDVEKANADLKKAQDDLKAANAEKDELNKTIETTKEQLKKFDGVDVESFKTQIKDLNDQIEKQKKDFEAQNLERLFHSKLDEKINGLKGKNTKAIKALLDVDALKESKNQDKDIDDALKKVADENKYLFGDNEPIHNPVGGTGGDGGAGGSDAENEKIRKIMGLPPKSN